MKEYINKAALVVEIERRIKEILFNHTENALVSKKVYREILSFINSLDVLTLDNIKEMENQAFMHGIEVERNKNIFKDNKEIKI